jgi:multidrug resistance efflux pump
VIDDGSAVRKGELVLEFDDTDVQKRLQAQRLVVEQAREAARVQTRREVLDEELARLREIERELENCRLFAPRDGIAVHYLPPYRKVVPPRVAAGEPIRAGQKLIQVGDMIHLQVALLVPGNLVDRVAEQQRALVRVEQFPGRVLTGWVQYVPTVANHVTSSPDCAPCL